MILKILTTTIFLALPIVGGVVGWKYRDNTDGLSVIGGTAIGLMLGAAIASGVHLIWSS